MHCLVFEEKDGLAGGGPPWSFVSSSRALTTDYRTDNGERRRTDAKPASASRAGCHVSEARFIIFVEQSFVT